MEIFESGGDERDFCFIMVQNEHTGHSILMVHRSFLPNVLGETSNVKNTSEDESVMRKLHSPISVKFLLALKMVR